VSSEGEGFFFRLAAAALCKEASCRQEGFCAEFTTWRPSFYRPHWLVPAAGAGPTVATRRGDRRQGEPRVKAAGGCSDHR